PDRNLRAYKPASFRRLRKENRDSRARDKQKSALDPGVFHPNFVRRVVAEEWSQRARKLEECQAADPPFSIRPAPAGHSRSRTSCRQEVELRKGLRTRRVLVQPASSVQT